jgi:hypothetical protein
VLVWVATLFPDHAAAQVKSRRFVVANYDFAYSEDHRTGMAAVHLLNGFIVVCTKEAAPAEVVDGEEIERPRAELGWHAELAAGTIDDFIFGRGISDIDVQTRLAVHLQQKILAVDRTCLLTDLQKRKLEVAGRGDMKRFFNRVTRLKGDVETYREIKEKPQLSEWLKQMYGLHAEINLIRQGPYDFLFDDGSMFSKTLRNLLTAEQAEARRRARQ